MLRNVDRIAAGLVMLMLVASVASAIPPKSAYVVVKQGDAIGAETVSTLGAPFTDGNGKVGCVGSLSNSERFVWWDTGPVFLSGSLLPDVVTGGESTMGVGNNGEFIYSPSVNGNDSVVTHGGVLLQKGDPIVPLPGLYSTFNSRPTMLPDGTAHWMGGSTATQGSSTSTNRHFFRATDPTDPNSITVLLSGGDVIEGKAIATTASNFTYDFSDNGLHHLHKLDMATGSSSNNDHIYLNGVFVAQEGQPTGQGDNWQGFGALSVNNAGNWVLAGDTDGPTATDAFVAYNGAIQIREGDTIDGITLASGAAIRDVSINNLDQVVHLWGWGSGASAQEYLFFGSATDLANSAMLLAIGDEIDVDGDLIADYAIADFEASTVIGPGLDLGDDGYIYVEVGMVPVTGGDEIEAIIRIAIPEPASLLLMAVGGLALIRRR